MKPITSSFRATLASVSMGLLASAATAQVHFEERLEYLYTGSAIASMDVSGVVLAVGFSGGSFDKFSGSAALYDLKTGALTTTIFPNDPGRSDRFGNAIAIDASILAVGSYRDDDNGEDSGAAYLFDAATGKQLHKLLPDDGASNAWFGRSVAIANGRVIVGSNRAKAAYVFDAATGQQIAKLLPPDGLGHNFGQSVGVDGTYIVVGASSDNEAGMGAGAIYVFDAATNQFLRKMLPPGPNYGGQVGICLSVDNGIVAAGAPYDAVSGLGRVGAAFVFDASSGQLLHKLSGLHGNPDARMGTSISIRNGLVLVGAEADEDQGDRSGAAFMFDVMSGKQLAKLFPSNGQPLDFFGLRCVLTEDAAIVASNDPDAATYYYNLPETNCIANLVDPASDILNFTDISAYLNLYNAVDPLADLSPPYFSIDFFDMARFLAEYNDGCP